MVSYENGKLYEFQKKNGQWVNSHKIDEEIFARSISVSENLMVVASDFYGSVGGLDLFMAEKDENDEWTDFKPTCSMLEQY